MRIEHKRSRVRSMRVTPTTPGQALRALRNAAGLTQDQVASEAGVSSTHLSRVENDERRANPVWIGAVAEAIARHLKTAS